MIFKNALVYREDKKFKMGSFQVENGHFIKITEQMTDSEIIDAEGCYVIPGLIDLHFHGAVGADFCDGNVDAIKTLTTYEASAGVTSICPATMTVSKEDLFQIMKSVTEYQKEMSNPKSCMHCSRLVGINMEGPFINEAKKGGQSADHILPCNVELFKELQKASGNMIKLVDIAPETENAIDFIKELKNDVVISVAHTTATYDVAFDAFSSGAKHVTHLYNAMPSFMHRDPGVIGAACDSDHCMVELICDGIHLHPSAVRTTFKMFGEDRIILISDSMRAVGLTDGTYTLGGQDVHVKGNRAILADGTLAGSVTNLMDCMLTAVNQMGIPFETAVACATMNPAKELGIYDQLGSITPGKYADFVLLDKELNVKAVYIGGIKIS